MSDEKPKDEPKKPRPGAWLDTKFEKVGHFMGIVSVTITPEMQKSLVGYTLLRRNRRHPCD